MKITHRHAVLVEEPHYAVRLDAGIEPAALKFIGGAFLVDVEQRRLAAEQREQLSKQITVKG
jgi:hypothetical protein